MGEVSLVTLQKDKYKSLPNNHRRPDGAAHITALQRGSRMKWKHSLVCTAKKMQPFSRNHNPRSEYAAIQVISEHRKMFITKQHNQEAMFAQSIHAQVFARRQFQLRSWR
jgi:hypothetical protein